MSLLRDLARAKAAFQARTLEAILTEGDNNMIRDLSPRDANLLRALASTSGRSVEEEAAQLTRNGRDLSEAINAAAHTLMNKGDGK